MPTASIPIGRFLVVFLSIISVSACQRATYSFPPPSVAVVLAIPVGSADISPTRYVPALGPLPAHAHRAGRLRAPGQVNRRSPLGLARHRQPAFRTPLAQTATGHVQRVVPTALPPDLPVRQRSRAVAIILAVLAITYVPLSLHNFYLGYYGRGAAAISLLVVGAYLLLLGTTGGLLTSGGLTAIGYLGVALLAGWFFWQLSDLFRIIKGDLQPKESVYKPKNLPG